MIRIRLVVVVVGLALSASPASAAGKRPHARIAVADSTAAPRTAGAGSGVDYLLFDEPVQSPAKAKPDTSATVHGRAAGPRPRAAVATAGHDAHAPPLR